MRSRSSRVTSIAGRPLISTRSSLPSTASGRAHLHQARAAAALSLSMLLLLISSSALLLLSPSAVRLACPLQRGRSAIRCAVGPADEAGLAAVLEACAEDPAALTKQLSKDQLRAECARRSLRITGTKADLAPRLVEALRLEQRAAPPAPLASGGAPPAPAPRPEVDGTAPAEPAVAAGGGLADRISQHLADAAAPAAAQPKRRAAPSVPSSPQPPAASSSVQPAAQMSEHGSSGVDVEMTILGSGACNPSPFRSASALALRVRGLVKKQGRYRRPARPKRLIGRGWPKLGIAWSMVWR